MVFGVDAESRATAVAFAVDHNLTLLGGGLAFEDLLQIWDDEGLQRVLGDTVDMFGYSFMSLATLFAARVFTGGGLLLVVRWFLTANGLLLPFLALQMYYPPLIWGVALWAVTFPGSTWSLAVLFHRTPTTGDGQPPG